MRYFDNVRKGRIEIIPMIDIMLFLLVFFVMLTAQMIPDRGLTYHLPGSHTASRLPAATVTVNLARDGSLTMNGSPISLAQLTARLAAMDHNRTHVVIAGAAKVSLQALIRVMDACREAGVRAVSVATRSLAATGAH